MIRAATGPLRTKRIHIGMDEAHGVSEGRFRQIFGYQDSTQVVRPTYSPEASPEAQLCGVVLPSSRSICVGSTTSASGWG